MLIGTSRQNTQNYFVIENEYRYARTYNKVQSLQIEVQNFTDEKSNFQIKVSIVTSIVAGPRDIR
jgi:hypothetical protein